MYNKQYGPNKKGLQNIITQLETRWEFNRPVIVYTFIFLKGPETPFLDSKADHNLKPGERRRCWNGHEAVLSTEFKFFKINFLRTCQFRGAPDTHVLDFW